MPKLKGLTVLEFSQHMAQYHHQRLDWGTQVVIRGPECDYGVAAVSIDVGGNLIIDLGQVL